jgi:OOP family OmpA-OmpF porin
MKAHPNDIGTIEGYADYKGPAEANLKLSQKRADAVKDYMVSKFGIPADRLKTKAFGEERPIADNTTPEGRAANRYAAEVFCEPEENVSEAK